MPNKKIKKLTKYCMTDALKKTELEASLFVCKNFAQQPPIVAVAFFRLVALINASEAMVMGPRNAHLTFRDRTLLERIKSLAENFNNSFFVDLLKVCICSFIF